jgi:hypothetical protein
VHPFLLSPKEEKGPAQQAQVSKDQDPFPLSSQCLFPHTHPPPPPPHLSGLHIFDTDKKKKAGKHNDDEEKVSTIKTAKKKPADTSKKSEQQAIMESALAARKAQDEGLMLLIEAQQKASHFALATAMHVAAASTLSEPIVSQQIAGSAHVDLSASLNASSSSIKSEPAPPPMPPRPANNAAAVATKQRSGDKDKDEGNASNGKPLLPLKIALFKKVVQNCSVCSKAVSARMLCKICQKSFCAAHLNPDKMCQRCRNKENIKATHEDEEYEAVDLLTMDQAVSKCTQLIRERADKEKQQQRLTRIDAEHLDWGERIASGSFGDVHEGMYCLQKVAIKVLRPNGLEFPEDFEREMQLHMSLCHPNIIRAFGHGHRDADSPCLVLEFVE